MPSTAPPSSNREKRQFKRRFSLQPSSFLGRDEASPRAGGRSPGIEECPGGGGGNEVVAAKHRHKIVVMGPTRGGKTSLISQFLYGTIPERYKRTVEEMHHGEFDVAGVRLTLDILDTSGAQEFPAMRALSISSADAFILVYGLDEPQDASLDEIRGLRDLILATKGCNANGVPIVVVGNKLDLVEVGPQSAIDRETVESIVTLDWEHGYVQASAKDNINVGKCFQELLNQAKVKYNLSPALRQRRRRQSLPAVAGSSPNSAIPPNAQPPPPPPVSRPPAPSHAELEKLEKIKERHSTGDKRNSCVIS